MGKKACIIFIASAIFLVSAAFQVYGDEYNPGISAEPAYINEQSHSQEAKEGESVKFQVKIEEMPSDYKVDYEWLFTPEGFGSGKQYTLHDGGGISGSASSSLTVRASALTEGEYICRVHSVRVTAAGNGDGGITSADPMSLTVINAKPIEPQKPSAELPGKPKPRVIAGEDSISVDWMQADDGGSVILAYYCQINKDTPHIIFFTPYGANITYFRGLEKGTDYTVKVWAENAVGEGKAETISVTTYGKKSEPPAEKEKIADKNKDVDKKEPADSAEPANSNESIVLTIGQPSMIIDGKAKDIDEQGTVPVIKNGRTLMPIRAVVEGMGGTVGWDGTTQTVILKNADNEIKLIIGNKSAWLNGKEHILDVEPVIINGRTMLPIRFVAESFGFTVDWDGESGSVTIK